MEKYKLKKIPDNINEILGTKYDNLFEKQIIQRGINYSLSNKINNLNIKDNLLSAQIKGTKIYDIKIEFEEDMLKKVFCSCPYHKKSVYCKHIYAVLYELNKNEREQIISKYKNYLTDNEKQVKDFFSEINQLVKYNKKKLSKKFLQEYEKKYYDLEYNLTNIKSDDLKLYQFNYYLARINNNYEKLINIYNEILKIKNIDTNLEELREKEIKSKRLENKICSNTATLKELINIRRNFNDFIFEYIDIKDIDEYISSRIEGLETVEEVEKIKKQLKDIGVSISMCDVVTRRLNGISPKDVENLDKEELEYYIYNCDDIMTLLSVKKQMMNYKFSEDYYEDITNSINSEIDSIYKLDKLLEVKEKMSEYNFNLKYINEAIYNLKYNKYKESKDPLIRKLDKYIEKTPMEVLELVSRDNIKNDRDNRIIEKAITNKKKKIEELKRIKRKEAIEDAIHSVFKIFTIIDGILSIFNSNSKSTRTRGYYSKYDYSSLEEEDLEEDDYYYDDLD